MTKLKEGNKPKKHFTIPSASKDAEQGNSHTLLVDVQNDAVTLENTLAVSYTVKNTLTT